MKFSNKKKLKYNIKSHNNEIHVKCILTLPFLVIVMIFSRIILTLRKNLIIGTF